MKRSTILAIILIAAIMAASAIIGYFMGSMYEPQRDPLPAAPDPA